MLMLWLAFAPARRGRSVRDRLDSHVKRTVDAIEADDLGRPFVVRALIPLVRKILRLLGRLLPSRNLETTQRLLVQAGNPGRLTSLDYYGLRLLLVVLLGGSYFLVLGTTVDLRIAFRNTMVAAAVGFFLPAVWLRLRIRRRRHEIQRALPDALDMLTIGVEAGLAFESALMRVGQRWDNALTREFRRAVNEMRVGTPRDVALRRIVDRTNVTELGTFVAVLIQSSQLGVSIAQVLHTQAAQMRVRRRQRAEELARQAGLKMVFALLLFVFPAMLVVILGPSIPAFGNFFSALGGGPGLGGIP
jgi:tight adherence protein C